MRKLTEPKLVLASHNKGKLVEIAALLEPKGFEVIGAPSLGLEEPEETEDTFAGNSRIKAHAAAKASGLPAISDDSGLQVDALNGAPGVYTADWAETPNGRNFPMAMEKVHKLLEEKDAPHPRTARFCCTLCVAWPDGHDEIFTGTVEGHLTWPMRGELGFGFDPVFIPDGETITFGEMDSSKKYGMSHRADAFAKLVSGILETQMPERKLISTGSPFEKTIGYSRAVVAGDWCFVSGVTGYDYKTMEMPDDVAEQAENCFATIKGVLAEAGFELADVVRVQYTLVSPEMVEQATPALGKAFGDIRPAATMVVAGLIKPEMKIEIEVTAFKG